MLRRSAREAAGGRREADELATAQPNVQIGMAKEGLSTYSRAPISTGTAGGQPPAHLTGRVLCSLRKHLERLVRKGPILDFRRAARLPTNVNTRSGRMHAGRSERPGSSAVYRSEHGTLALGPVVPAHQRMRVRTPEMVIARTLLCPDAECRQPEFLADPDSSKALTRAFVRRIRTWSNPGFSVITFLLIRPANVTTPIWYACPSNIPGRGGPTHG
jgi:hypothetical protein